MGDQISHCLPTPAQAPATFLGARTRTNFNVLQMVQIVWSFAVMKNQDLDLLQRVVARLKNEGASPTLLLPFAFIVLPTLKTRLGVLSSLWWAYVIFVMIFRQLICFLLSRGKVLITFTLYYLAADICSRSSDDLYMCYKQHNYYAGCVEKKNS